MKLFDSSSSPFVRKVNICLIELGLDNIVERLPQNAHPIRRDTNLVARNPLGQVPAIILDDGSCLADSRVICEYINDVANGRLFPAPSPARWTALARQSAADGLLDAAIQIRYEMNARPPELQFDDWIEGQKAKIESVLAVMEREAQGLRDLTDIGTISYACALGYLDFRFLELNWRKERYHLAAWFDTFSLRPSFQRTMPRPR